MPQPKLLARGHGVVQAIRVVKPDGFSWAGPSGPSYFQVVKDLGLGTEVCTRHLNQGLRICEKASEKPKTQASLMFYTTI